MGCCRVGRPHHRCAPAGGLRIASAVSALLLGAIAWVVLSESVAEASRSVVAHSGFVGHCRILRARDEL